MLTNADLDQLAHDTAESGFEHLEALAEQRGTSRVSTALASYYQLEVFKTADDQLLAYNRQQVVDAAAQGQDCLWTWQLACGCRFKGITGDVNPDLICASHRSK